MRRDPQNIFGFIRSALFPARVLPIRLGLCHHPQASQPVAA
jgi:hypothetical protein